MKYARDRKIGLPSTGTLKDGRTVSGYDCLPIETLKAEGWKECTEIIPEVGAGQVLEIDTYDDSEDIVVVTYKAADKPISDILTYDELLDAYLIEVGAI